MRILIVEDEHRIANTIKRGLEQECYAVDVAYNGKDGFDLASTEEYDLIILDILLPLMDGFTFCKELRRNQIDTPILMLTAKGQIQDKVEGLDAGADDYLTKPFSFEELLARIRALTRRPKSFLNSTLKIKDLHLDPKLFQVKRRERIIKLTKKEFSLLEYLMRNAGRIVSKEQIISHVWNYDADILPNTVEAHIGRLRRKLGKPAIIQTVRGFGYQISD